MEKLRLLAEACERVKGWPPEAWRWRTGWKGRPCCLISLANHGVGDFNFTLGINALS